MWITGAGSLVGLSLSLSLVGLGLFIPLLMEISQENIGLFRDDNLNENLIR